MHFRVQKHAAIPYRIDSLNFLFYFLYFVHLLLFRSVDLNSKSLIKKKLSAVLILFFIHLADAEGECEAQTSEWK
jgi:hypothetical protein